MVCGYVLVWLLLFYLFFSLPLTSAALFAWCVLNKLIFGIQCNKPEPGFIRRNPKQNPLKLVSNFSLVSFGVDGHKLTPVCGTALLSFSRDTKRTMYYCSLYKDQVT